MASIAVILLLSYLAGSIPGSVWMGQLLYGVDVRKHGSLNAGATNVFRVLGGKLACYRLLLIWVRACWLQGDCLNRIDECHQGSPFGR